MCGIVAFFAKTPAFEAKLGEYLSHMLIEMTDRGPDSAGVALYRNPAPENCVKLSLFSPDPDYLWADLADSLGAALHIDVSGENTHHMVEACFKSVGRSLRQAIRKEGIELPSTKGTLN